MQIALVADSHGSLDRLRKVCENLNNAGITHLIHAGDGVNYGIEEIFAQFPAIQIHYALGNCDVNRELIEEMKKLPNCKIDSVLSLEIEGIKIGISHIEGIAEGFLQNENIQIFCHGHTHRAKQEIRENKLILNPGALTEDGFYFLLNLKSLEIQRKRFDEKIT